MRLPKKPPIQGLPKPDPAPPPVKDRPRCPTCTTALRPEIAEEERLLFGDTAHEFQFEITRRWWSGAYQGYGAFCTMRCGVEFANAAYNAGHRLYGEEG